MSAKAEAMCGISLIVQPSASTGLVQRLGAMHNAIPHRGPDGEGVMTQNARTVMHADRIDDLPSGPAQLGLAFRRLAIRDLGEAASQPMGAGDVWLAFNGEIYNFEMLRTQLTGLGHEFRGSGDSEVVLAAYREWGSACFTRFEGMWAIVVVDVPANRLILSRDRFGIKPLFWTIDRHGALIVGSEVKQILVAREEAPRANRPLVEMFLRGQRYPFVEETFFDGIYALPPASWCAMPIDAPAAPEPIPYWRLSDFCATQTVDHSDAVAEAETLLARAVETHRQADVRVGALLSGGIDSSTIVGLAAGAGHKLPTYSLGYREAAPEACELQFVDAMVAHHGLENHEIGFDAAWIADNVDTVLGALEEPPLAMPAFAQYRVFQLCRRHGATVVLDGQGADEIFGGYHYHQRIVVRDLLKRGRFGAALRELRAIGRADHRSAIGLFTDWFVKPYLRRPRPLSWIVAAPPAPARFAEVERGRDPSALNQQLYFDVRWANAKIILGYADRNAMAHSVEARVPYFDRALVEFAFGLPADHKVSRGNRKRVLRDVARRHVPPMITERPDRMGFGTPDAAMLAGPLRPLVRDAMADPQFRAAGWIDAEQADRFVLDFEQGRHHDYRAVWRLFMLSRWAQHFGVEG
ncbi:hypothetical protein SPAN111604_04245 [Sphingomonas antarctica]|uniref:asparagine synthase (glutamine-hydrolyzing) n=1 Tax=Sphingomonas antarctica TaxID=2040274 RepID=UPI0039EB2D81